MTFENRRVMELPSFHGHAGLCAFLSYGFIVPWPCRLTLIVLLKEHTYLCVPYSKEMFSLTFENRGVMQLRLFHGHIGLSPFLVMVSLFLGHAGLRSLFC
jgi:hypothetical protein